MNKVLLLILGGIFILIGGIFFSLNTDEASSSDISNDKIHIVKTWDLPDILKEISGIAYLGKNEIACIQDEEGIIFIYDLESSSIKEEINFAGPGDYEAITMVGTTAYVLRSDGTIFEVIDFRSKNRKTTEYKIPVTSDHNFEGMAFEKNNGQLLLVIKEKSENIIKPIYAFDIRSKQLKKEPLFKIDFNDPTFKILNEKVSRKMLRPSEITIQPNTGKIFVLEGVKPKLLILDPAGNPEKIYQLNKDQFPQAEGLTFGENGEIYISNEANGARANILKISLK